MIAIAMIAGINVYNAQKTEPMSDETKRKTDSGVTGYLYKIRSLMSYDQKLFTLNGERMRLREDIRSLFMNR